MLTSMFALDDEGSAQEASGEGGADSGFTLIELMVVLLIIAILLAIAIPTFLGVSGSARDRSAQSNVTNALTNSIAYYQNGQNFDATTGAGGTATSQTGTGGGSTAGALQSTEPAFTWVAGGTACATNAPKCVSIAPVDVATADDGQGVILSVMAGTGNCWYAMNLQANPVAQPNATTAASNYNGATGAATPGLLKLDGGAAASLTSAGTYYAFEKANTASGSCSALHAEGFANWYSTYAKASAASE